MADEKTKTETKPVSKQRLGFDTKGKARPGVDPTTGERMSIVYSVLIDEFGYEEGKAKYEAIAGMEVDVVHPVTHAPQKAACFFDPAREAETYRPDLAIASLSAETRARVAEILSTSQTAAQPAEA